MLAAKFTPSIARRAEQFWKTKINEIVTRDYTIHLHKRIHDRSFKSKAPRAVREVRKFAEKTMGTKDVRLDVKLNKHIWSRGIKNVPTRIRVRLSRRRNDDEDAENQLYTLVSHVQVTNSDGKEINPKGLQTEVVNE